MQGFVSWLGQRDTVPLIQALQVQADDWRAAELARARRLLARGEDVDAVLEALSRGLTQKLLHGTLVELQSGDPAQRERAAEVGLAHVPARHAAVRRSISDAPHAPDPGGAAATRWRVARHRHCRSTR